MRKPLNNPMPPQTSGIAKMAEQKTMMMAEAMSMAKKMSKPMAKIKGCCN